MSGAIISENQLAISYGAASNRAVLRGASDDATRIGLACGDGTDNCAIAITRDAVWHKDHDHDTILANPTLFVHSSTDPDSANDEWISFTHDVTNGVIDVGSGVRL